MNGALLLALAVYVGIGLALPLALGVRVPLLTGLNVIGASLGWAITLAWLYPLTEARARRQLLEQTSNLRLLSASEFERLVGELLRRAGWEVEEVGGHGQPDGGVDLVARRESTRRLVQCKRWDSRQVGVAAVRELAGALLHERLPGEAGMLVTVSDYTPDARQEAASTGTELVDHRDLVRRLDARATQLLRLDTSDRRYPCSDCGAPMLLARSPHGYWLHRPRYRDGCRGKRDLGTEPEQAIAQLIKLR
jgi:restriction system protein